MAMMGTAALLVSCGDGGQKSQGDFKYLIDEFADLKIMRYQIPGWDELSLRQKEYVYHLGEAAKYGRDIIWMQNCEVNLPIRKAVETVIEKYEGDRDSKDYQDFLVYAKRLFFSNGIHHHYAEDKFFPDCSQEYFRSLLESTGQADDADMLLDWIYNPDVFPQRKSMDKSGDIVAESAVTFYDNVTRAEVEKFYADMADPDDPQPISYGLNSKLVKRNGQLTELVYSENGLFGEAIKSITSWLNRALNYTENEAQAHLIELLVKYYRTGNLKDFDKYSIAWVSENEGMIDFVNGFIEVYGDPLGLKGTWEGIVEYKDLEATKRTQTISDNAQWFEDHSPVNPKYRKPVVKGVTANVIQELDTASAWQQKRDHRQLD